MNSKLVPYVHAIGSALPGVVLGGATAVLALGMGGAGHGWCSAVVSALSIVGAPMACIAWSRRETSGVVLPYIVVAFALALDFGLCALTMQEGFEYARRVVDVMPGYVVLWLLLFGSWQVLGFAALLRVQNRGSEGDE